jgi:hypothetical protein
MQTKGEADSFLGKIESREGLCMRRRSWQTKEHQTTWEKAEPEILYYRRIFPRLSLQAIPAVYCRTDLRNNNNTSSSTTPHNVSILPASSALSTIAFASLFLDTIMPGLHLCVYYLL